MYMLYCLFFSNLVDVNVVVYDVYVLFFNVYVVGEMLINLFLLKSIILLLYEFCNCKCFNLFII